MLQKTTTKHALICVLLSLLALEGCNNDCNNDLNQKYSQTLVKDTSINNVTLVKVSSGWFKQGLNCDIKTLNYDYWIGKYEVTNEQFFAFLNQALQKRILFIKNKQLLINYNQDNHIPNGNYCVKYLDHAIYLNEKDELILNPTYAKHPAISVTWFGADAFCKFYGFKLPSTDEWEKAARGNNCSRFPWGNNINPSYANYYNSQDPYEPGTTPVGFYNGNINQGFKTQNAVSPYGCYDMAGNAWEWTRDKFNNQSLYYCGKGGGFNLHTAAYLQVYYISTFRVKEASPPLDRSHLSDGFRVVMHTNN